MTTTITATQIAPAAQQWLHSTRSARVLHLFDSLCNLVNDKGDVLTITNQTIGPFALRLNHPIPFNQQLTPTTPITIHPTHLHLGTVQIKTDTAVLWQPIPPWTTPTPAQWQTLLPHINHTLSQATSQITTLAPTAITQLTTSIHTNNLTTCQTAVYTLAGLGPGLTPAGDDFLVGTLYALHALGKATPTLCQTILKTAVPRTTTLSAAWLHAAAKGEAIPPWHQLVYAVTNHDETAVFHALHHIIQQGHTSGADALTGFVTQLATNIL